VLVENPEVSFFSKNKWRFINKNALVAFHSFILSLFFVG
jgi:hypothetical protein